MRGRKHTVYDNVTVHYKIIKKESPNEGTETVQDLNVSFFLPSIKKESPNEGTETAFSSLLLLLYRR